MTIAEEIHRYLIEELAVGAGDAALTPETRLLELGMDSVSIFQMTLYLEEEYEIELAPEDAVPANFATPAAIVALVERKRG